MLGGGVSLALLMLARLSLSAAAMSKDSPAIPPPTVEAALQSLLEDPQCERALASPGARFCLFLHGGSRVSSQSEQEILKEVETLVDCSERLVAIIVERIEEAHPVFLDGKGPALAIRRLVSSPLRPSPPSGFFTTPQSLFRHSILVARLSPVVEVLRAFSHSLTFWDLGDAEQLHAAVKYLRAHYWAQGLSDQISQVVGIADGELAKAEGTRDQLFIAQLSSALANLYRDLKAAIAGLFQHLSSLTSTAGEAEFTERAVGRLLPSLLQGKFQTKTPPSRRPGLYVPQIPKGFIGEDRTILQLLKQECLIAYWTNTYEVLAAHPELMHPCVPDHAPQSPPKTLPLASPIAALDEALQQLNKFSINEIIHLLNNPSCSKSYRPRLLAALNVLPDKLGTSIRTANNCLCRHIIITQQSALLIGSSESDTIRQILEKHPGFTDFVQKIALLHEAAWSLSSYEAQLQAVKTLYSRTIPVLVQLLWLGRNFEALALLMGAGVEPHHEEQRWNIYRPLIGSVGQQTTPPMTSLQMHQ